MDRGATWCRDPWCQEPNIKKKLHLNPNAVGQGAMAHGARSPGAYISPEPLLSSFQPHATRKRGVRGEGGKQRSSAEIFTRHFQVNVFRIRILFRVNILFWEYFSCKYIV